MKSIIVQLFCAYAGSLSFAFLFNVRGIALPLSAFGGCLGWGVYLGAQGLTGRTVVPYFVASLALSLYAEIAARIKRDPVTLYLIPALIPVVPGAGMYNTLYEFIMGSSERGTALLLETLSIAGAIAMGVGLVSSVMRSVARKRPL